MTEFIAHVRESDREVQTLDQHLIEVCELAGSFAEKIGVGDAGKLIGLLHDFGKYSQAFQRYIKSAQGHINPDEDDYVDAASLKGKVDHSTAGAQLIWTELNKLNCGPMGALCAQILALCVASHHSGLIDCLDSDGGNNFDRRMKKENAKTHLEECVEKSDLSIIERAKSLLSKEFIQKLFTQLQLLMRNHQHNQEVSYKIQCFYLGFWTRYLFSCLIDADRINSADFESPRNKALRSQGNIDWSIPINRAESFLMGLPIKYDVDLIRRDISNRCKERSSDPQGIYSLSVPTGGGKTYASLRYALHHAKHHQLDRILYVIPYTSIIEQNAEQIRKVIELDEDVGKWVFEHHSNLEPEKQTWHSKLVSESWDSPIILTTMVQFLEILFSGGTRSVRRLHQLANTVIIFDEIQTLPISCTHIFCNALNFLTTYTNTTAVLCTATQPLLNKLREPKRGQLFLPPENELIGSVNDVAELFEKLKRVEVINRLKQGGWTANEIASLAISELNNAGSCLIIVNTKAWAQILYEVCALDIDSRSLFHLSTSQCPAHRKKILDEIRLKLENQEPVLCISTQLIEAGVDVDFGSVIRFLAGLDSIAQAAGRCNRNGKRSKGTVHVVNPEKENIESLPDILFGRDKADRVLREKNIKDILSPEIMKQYFQYYFFDRSDEMVYPLSKKQIGKDDNLLNLLSDNEKNIGKNQLFFKKLLKHSFMTAGKAFKAIDAPTEAVIVPYGEGKEIITQLCAVAKEFNPGQYYRLLKLAQKYSVNLFPNIREKLVDTQAIYEIQDGEGIYFLDERHYSDAFGVSVEPVNQLAFMGC
jgi:CRISPR-associated endonuclease/helicase Cas3